MIAIVVIFIVAFVHAPGTCIIYAGPTRHNYFRIRYLQGKQCHGVIYHCSNEPLLHYYDWFEVILIIIVQSWNIKQSVV